MNSALWASEFSTAMPSDMTYEKFRVKRQKKWLGEYVQDASEAVRWAKELHDKYASDATEDILKYYQADYRNAITNKINAERYGVELWQPK